MIAKKFRDLRKTMNPEAQERSHAKVLAMMENLPLTELRQAHYYSQEQLAAELQVKQPVVAKLEK